MNPDGTPITQPALPAPAAQTTPAAAPAAARGDHGIDNTLPQGTPHPGEMNLSPTSPTPSAQVAAPPAADPAQLPAGVSPEAAATASQSAANSAREIAAAMGFGDAVRFQDDQTFLQAVMAQAQAGAQAQQQLQALQQHQAMLYQQQLLAQQQAQPVAPAAPKLNPIWNPPEYNPAWANMVTRDPATGAVAPIPGVPQEIASKVMAFEAYRKQFADRFLSNPEQTLMPLIEQTAEAKAQEMIRRELKTQQDSQFIQGFVSQNSGWLHQTDAQGQVVRNAAGAPVLSPAGRRFQEHVNAAHAAGVQDIRQQEAWARTALQNDIMRAQLQQAQGRQQTQTAVVEANRRPSQAGVFPQPGVSPVPMPGMSLQERLALAMREAGMTDQMIDANLG